jgi:hypothetical protein
MNLLPSKNCRFLGHRDPTSDPAVAAVLREAGELDEDDEFATSSNGSFGANGSSDDLPSSPKRLKFD